MAVEMFLDLDACKGESIANGHENQVDILAWNWGVANQGSGHLGGGSGTGKASFHDLTITKYVDKATSTILENCAKGKHFTKATLFCRKVGGDAPLEYLEIEMDQVFVSGVQHGGSLGDGSRRRCADDGRLDWSGAGFDRRFATHHGRHQR